MFWIYNSRQLCSKLCDLKDLNEKQVEFSACFLYVKNLFFEKTHICNVDKIRKVENV